MSDKLLKISVILTAVDKMSEIISRSVEKSQSKLKRFQHGLNSFGNYALIAGSAGVEFFHKTIEEAEQSEKAAHIAERVWKNMGDKTGEAFKKAHQFAEDLAPQIGIFHDEIERVESKLAIFGKVSDEMARKSGFFNRTVIAAFNAQALGFGDAEDNIKRFGMALQDPDQYLKRLTRSGIYFNKTTIDQIKHLQKSGNLHKAQSIILNQLDKRFGGVAISGVTAAEKLSVKWREFKVYIGEKLLPVWDKLIEKLMKVVDQVEKFTAAHPKLVKWLAASAVGLLALGVAAKVVAFIMTPFSAIWGLAGKALLFFGADVTIANKLLMATGIGLILTAIAVAAYLIIDNWSAIKKFFADIWNSISSGAKKAWKWIVDKWNGLGKWFRGLWDGVKRIASSVWNGIVNAITRPIKWIKEKWTELKNWFKNLWAEIFGGMPSYGKAFGFDPNKKIPLQENPALSRAFGISIPKKIINNNDTLTKVLQPVYVKPSPAPIPQRSAGIGATNLYYSPTLHYTGDNKDDFKKMLDDHAQHIVRITTEVQRKRDRTKF